MTNKIIIHADRVILKDDFSTEAGAVKELYPGMSFFIRLARWGSPVLAALSILWPVWSMGRVAEFVFHTRVIFAILVAVPCLCLFLDVFGKSDEELMREYIQKEGPGARDFSLSVIHAASGRCAEIFLPAKEERAYADEICGVFVGRSALFIFGPGQYEHVKSLSGKDFYVSFDEMEFGRFETTPIQDP